MARSQRRTALLYDAPLATPQDLALVKGMLLFFDDVAVFSTPPQSPRSPPIDHRLAAPLVERGLLHFVAPLELTRSQTEAIVRATLHRAVMEHAEQWLAAAAAGEWDLEVPRLQGRFPGTGLMRAGESSAAPDPASLHLLKLLAQDGLLLPDDAVDDERIVIPGVASVANSILAQAVRTTAGEQGWLIEPVATRRDEAKVFTAVIEDAVEGVRAADVVVSDLSPVTVDLVPVGLDDLLDFRARHRSELRAHALALQALLAPAAKPGDVVARRAALVDQARRLGELQRRRWPNLGEGLSLGVIGVAWALASGDLLGALIGAAGSHLLPVGPTPASAYTYVLRAHTEPDDEYGAELLQLGPGT
jgi:hypothetical protein